MILWTWQFPGAEPCAEPESVDPRSPRSYFGRNPEYRAHLKRLWCDLESDRLLWCFMDELESKTWHSEGQQRWRLEIPDPIEQACYAATIDSPVWEKILGNRIWPHAFAGLADNWYGAGLEFGSGGKYRDDRIREYHELEPPANEWWDVLYLDSPQHRGWSHQWLNEQLGEDADSPPQVLLKRPLPEPWCHRDPA